MNLVSYSMHHPNQKLVSIFNYTTPTFWLQLGQDSRTTETSLKIYDTNKPPKITKNYMC